MKGYSKGSFLLMITLAGCASNTNTNITNANRAMNNSKVENTTNSVADTSSSPVESKMTDADFLKAMVISGVSQVELGKIASTKATDDGVKEFAQMMVNEHSKASEELKALASKLKVTVRTEADSSQRSVLDNFRKRVGPEFDKAYVDAMVDVHQATIADFDSKANDATDPDLKAFAVKTLPTLRRHLEQITAIQAKLK